MSVKKTMEVTAPIPVDMSYEILCDVGRSIGWKVVEENKHDLVIKWKQGGRMNIKLAISAHLKPMGDDTLITLYGKIPGIAMNDGPGNIPKAWENLLVPFGVLAEESGQVISSVKEGLMCPKCGKNLSPGTQFCPNDGTAISLKCSSCDAINTPSAKFCLDCGKSL